MSAKSEKVRKALYVKLNVAGVTSLVSGIYHGAANVSASYPFLTFSRQAAGAVGYTFQLGLGIEDDLWMIKAASDEDSSSASSPQSLNETILSAAETAIGTSLTLPDGTENWWTKRLADIPEIQETVNDRLVYTNGFLLRVVSK